MFCCDSNCVSRVAFTTKGDMVTPKNPYAEQIGQPVPRMTTALRPFGIRSSVPPTPGTSEEVVWINFNQNQSAFLKKWAVSDKSITNNNSINNEYLTVNRMKKFVRAVLHEDQPADQESAETMGSAMNSDKPSVAGQAMGSAMGPAIGSDIPPDPGMPSTSAISSEVVPTASAKSSTLD